MLSPSRAELFPIFLSKPGSSLSSLSFFRLLKKQNTRVCSQHAPRPVSLAGYKSFSPASLVLFAHSTPKHTRAVWPKAYNSLSTSGHTCPSRHLFLVFPFSQHQKRRHDSFKTKNVYCRWGTGSPLPLWRPIWLSSLPEFRP
ncbi:hypothetical protein TNCV_1395031 [Trichonephila clavipes]|nr:hypothetical protein TNCV_1395031 [Trichonephila clavipes]